MLTVSNLCKSYGSKQVVRDLSFTLMPGRVLGFVGPNGAGKSTTMRMLVGLTEPDSGEVSFAGRRYSQIETPSNMVGVLLDANSAHPGRTARNHLRSLAALSGIGDARVDQVLQQVGLGEVAAKKVKTFSLGMKQRLGLASALLGEPELLILDEPANGLDPIGIRWLREYLRSFVSTGGSVLISSHLIGELAQLVDDLLIVGQGRTLASGTIDEIMALSDEGMSLEDVFVELSASEAEYVAV